MNFADLYAFYEVARHGGFSQASSVLRVAQSSLSRRVTRLEHQLGIELFVRHGRGVKLTSDGEALAARAEDLMRQVKDIETDIRERNDRPSGRVVVAFTPNSGQILGPYLLKAALQYPQLDIVLREGFSASIHDWLLSGEVDMALLYDPEPAAGLELTPLLKEPLLFVGATSKMQDLQCRHASADLLGRVPLVLPGRTHSLHLLLDRLAQKSGAQLQIRYQVDGTRMIKGIVEAGLAYTVFAYAGLYEEILAGSLTSIPFEPALHWTLALVRRTELQNLPAVNFVKQTVISEVHRLNDGGLWSGQLLI
ncbi:LysR family transcriptional regulator [Roseiarcaceae bacterium H3SJ34-1]|uniref:LysR family transcriptional regulator n=1 Tax=Terripilifer ovatus TaxID=3032367 RepID=UPI003AB9599D|nr:LysR family transcriptional regulator [Roseiarcaceae bacterium H3SJ34-1]